MFDLEYKGGNAVLITTKDRQLLIDGNMELLGLKELKLNDVVNLTTEKRFLPTNTSADSVWLDGPGEYEVGPFTVRGVAAQRMLDNEGHNTTIYRIEVGDIALGILGNIASKLDDDQLEALGIVDILVIPVGGNGYTLDASDAAKLVRQIEPKAVVPVYYGEAGVKYEVPQDDLDRFKHELAAPVEEVSKLKIKNSAALPATLTMIEVTRS